MESVVTAVGDNSGQELDLDQALAWVEANKPTIPACVYNTVKVVAKLRTDFQEAKGRANRLLALFRTQLGLLPKSERGTAAQKDKLDAKANTQTPEEHLAALKARKARLLAEIRRYEERIGKGRKNKKKTSTSPNSDTALEQQIPEHAFERCSEELFSGKLATAQDGGERLKVPKQENFENPRGLHSTSDDRTRYDFGVTTKTLKLQVETLTDPRTGKSVTASTDHIGPPNSQATWSAIANTITAVIGYAIPINRLSAMLKGSCPYFTSARLCSYLKMAAELFEPIYICLGENLADADVLHGDDTKARVVEISNALKDGGSLQDATEGSLIAKVAEVFGRVFLKKRGTGTKRSLNVSVVIGKTNVADPRSYIFFFRSHLGSFGDLLTKILENRSPRKKALTIVSDLATTNLVSQQLYDKFSITHAGCSAHARRPFWRYKDDDQRLCYWMLSAFLILEQIEDRIDELGRTKERIIRYRSRYSRKIWVAISKRCEEVLKGDTSRGPRWHKTSKLYGACEYIVNHYTKLTRYLDDPRLPSNNNLSERLLRWDKIMQDSSKFRLTEAGRLHVDILRTIVHTCSAARVELNDYLLFVFKHRDAIAADPQSYTPLAYATKHIAKKSA